MPASCSMTAMQEPRAYVVNMTSWFLLTAKSAISTTERCTITFSLVLLPCRFSRSQRGHRTPWLVDRWFYSGQASHQSGESFRMTNADQSVICEQAIHFGNQSLAYRVVKIDHDVATKHNVERARHG